MSRRRLFLQNRGSAADERFIITVKTDNAGTSADNQFTIPTSTSGITQAFLYDIETSDGQTITGNTGDTTITFPSAGTYDVKISGSFPFMRFNNGGDKAKLLDIKNFGIYALGATSQNGAFYGCSNMVITATDSGNFGSVTNFAAAWVGCSSLTSFPLLDTSSGTNFNRAWDGCSSLASFPANAFDTNIATIYTNAFRTTNLTTQSIDDILVSLDTSGVSNGTFTQSGGNAPSATGEAAIDSLVGKGWTITVTGGYVPIAQFPNWEDNDVEGSVFMTALNNYVPQTFNNTTNTFGSLGGSVKWTGGVLAPNGKIYGIPINSLQVLEIDPITNTTTLFGSLSGSTKWFGGVLAPNGKIYGIPYNSTQVLEIDPVTQTTTLFGSLSGTNKWTGGVLAPNGKIYGIPRNSTQFLEIDPITQTTTLFGSLSGTNKWYGGVLAPNGKIYGIPYNSTQVLEIDPVTQTTTLFGSLGGSVKWTGGVLAPNGKIYGIPSNSLQVLEIDPVNQTTTLFGSLGGSVKWIGGVLAPNGKIYGIPVDSSQVLEIDPITNTTTLFGSLSGQEKWLGGVLAPNGKIYGIPFSSTQVLEIGDTNTQEEDFVLSRYVNKL